VRYDLETVNGRIEEISTSPSREVRTQGGARQLQRRSEALHCETVNGTIRLKT
jgi:DUF4097 and DUF4098 domain-containing protein YvlB